MVSDSNVAGLCQRWRYGLSRFRPPQETIDTGRHAVTVIDERTAKTFVETHHYSGSYPAARARFGLFRKEPNRAEQLVGVAVFSVPVNQNAIPKYTGLSPKRGVELGRFVLVDTVESMGETWFLARCTRMLPELLPDIGSVVSYADPMPRRSRAGCLVKPGHIGLIYQAHNAVYGGRASARTLVMAADGTVVSERTLTKLRNSERGARYAYDTLRRLGAPPIRSGESDRTYVNRALAEAGFRKIRHPGNHVYAFPVGDRGERRRVKHQMPPGHPFPRVSEADPVAQAA